MHSSTKYLAGHSDALGGVLVVPKPKVAEDLRSERTLLGCVFASVILCAIVLQYHFSVCNPNEQDDPAMHTAICYMLDPHTCLIDKRRI